MLRTFAIASMGVALLLMVGCAGGVEITTLLSAGSKLASNPADPPIGDLTAAELVAVVANLPQLAAQFPELGIPDLAWLPPLSLQQAQDLVAFMARYGLRTMSDLQRFLVLVAEGAIEVEIPQSLIDFAAAMGFETDAARLAAEIG